MQEKINSPKSNKVYKFNKNHKLNNSMKKRNFIFAFAFVLIFASLGVSYAQVGINTTGNSPHSSSMLDIDVSGMSPKAGLLIPRMTTTERNAISSPAQSLLIFNTTTECFEAYNTSTNTWVAFGCIGCQLPGSFSATAASGITSTSFSANWTASAGATTYYLDVSTVSNFATFVPGYNNLNVGNVTTYSVTGLSCNTTYYYRLRAGNSCGTSVNSNTITVSTTNPTGTQTFDYTGAAQTFTVPACVTSITVRIVGGGGGGQMGWGNSSVNSGGGAGGGAGTYITNVYSVTPGSNLTLYVGRGGAPGVGGCICGTSCSGPAGQNGEASYITSLVTAAGGAGGNNNGTCYSLNCGGSWNRGTPGTPSGFPGSTGGVPGCNGCVNCEDGQGGTPGGAGTLGGGGGGGASSTYWPNDTQTNGGWGGNGRIEISW